MEKTIIPTISENPTGLHQRFLIKKLTGRTVEDFFGQHHPEVIDVDPNAEYFVLRLDSGGSDPKHIAACRKAVLAYAEAIKDHIPKLAADLIERYGK
jgi:hypothetical protein